MFISSMIGKCIVVYLCSGLFLVGRMNRLKVYIIRVNFIFKKYWIEENRYKREYNIFLIYLK